jgi:serine/threonine protein kinase
LAREQEKEAGFTRWLKAKFLGRDKEQRAVDTQFLEDLKGIEKVGRYEIMEKLGQGSMGVVYKGRDPYIERFVSIKISRPPADVGSKKTDEYRKRFFLEAQSAGRLSHPNIVAIYDAGMYRDFCYTTMEYIDGPSLKKFCDKDNLLPFNKVVEMIIPACKALDYAHQKGLIHRDIKPSNIMINKSEEVRITDFGIARVKTEQTLSKGIIGSPSYMSPEQVKEEPIEQLSDVFSLGCVLYELLTGVQAFPGDNYFAIMYKITNEDPVPIREIRPDVPEILDNITVKALNKNPAQRYQTCMDLAYDLRSALRYLKEEVVKEYKAEDVVDYIHNVHFFSDFTRKQVQEIIETADMIKVAENTVMIAEGEVDDSFYIILSGRAVVRKNNKDIAIIGTGECFGEMAYLSGHLRTATVTADTDCILLKISSMFLDKAPQDLQLLFLKRFAITLLRRLSVSTSKID